MPSPVREWPRPTSRYDLPPVEWSPAGEHHAHTVVLKLRDDLAPPYVDGAHQRLQEPLRSQWGGLEATYGRLSMDRLFLEPDPEALTTLVRTAERRSGRLPADPLSFFRITLPSARSAAAVAYYVSGWEDAVDAVYVESGPLPPPNPLRQGQRYRKGDALGINADGIDTANQAGGDGNGVVVADVEGGWVLDHQYLPAGIPLSGENYDYHGHGAAVLSVLADRDDDQGGLGIAHGCTPRAFSVWRYGRFGFGLHRFSAVMAAVADLNPGDIILLEIQVGMASYRNGSIEWLVNLPAEADLGLWVAIRLASALGITVIEAAGNGNHDLDAKLPWLQRGSWADSGAILVAAASSECSPTKTGSTNWGTRVDCHSWGENIVCAGASDHDMEKDKYRTNFGGTSGAAAIIAGAAAAVQGRVRALGQKPLTPGELRALLGDWALGSTAKSSGLGCQPDLTQVLSKL